MYESYGLTFLWAHPLSIIILYSYIYSTTDYVYSDVNKTWFAVKTVASSFYHSWKIGSKNIGFYVV